MANCFSPVIWELKGSPIVLESPRKAALCAWGLVCFPDVDLLVQVRLGEGGGWVPAPKSVRRWDGKESRLGGANDTDKPFLRMNVKSALHTDT